MYGRGLVKGHGGQPVLQLGRHHQARDGLAVVDLPGHDHADGFGKREGPHAQEFVRVGVHLVLAEPRGQINADLFVAEARRGVQHRQQAVVFRPQAGFLLQFAAGAVQHVLPNVVQLARRDLPGEAAHRHPVLAHHGHVARVVQGHHRRRAPVLDHLAQRLLAVGQEHLPMFHIDKRPLKHLFRGTCCQLEDSLWCKHRCRHNQTL